MPPKSSFFSTGRADKGPEAGLPFRRDVEFFNAQVHAADSTSSRPLRHSACQGALGALRASLGWSSFHFGFSLPLWEVSKEELALADQPRIFSLQKLVEAGLCFRGTGPSGQYSHQPDGVGRVDRVSLRFQQTRWQTSTWAECESSGVGYGAF